MKSKRQSKKQSNNKVMEIDMVGEQITVEQLTELSVVMRISRYDHVYRHHVRDK